MITRGVIYHIILAEANGPAQGSVRGRAGALALVATRAAWRGRGHLFLSTCRAAVVFRAGSDGQSVLFGARLFSPGQCIADPVGDDGRCRRFLGGPGKQRAYCGPGPAKRKWVQWA